eukprot:9314747-Pyramimonas_sp.AAC.1
MICSVSLALFLALAAAIEACTDDPAGWVDSWGYSCADYADGEWCTESGGYGPGWDFSWGTF